MQRQSQQLQSAKRLTKNSSLDKELVEILKAVLRDVESHPSENFFVVVGKQIVQKLTRFNSVIVKEKTVQTLYAVNKTIKEYCTDLMLQVLIKIAEYFSVN